MPTSINSRCSFLGRVLSAAGFLAVGYGVSLSIDGDVNWIIMGIFMFLGTIPLTASKG